MKIRFTSLVLLASIFLFSCGNQDDQGLDDENAIPAPITLSYQVVNKFPHDTAAFTEGFTFYNGALYESTGAPDSPATNGTWIAAVDINTGKYDKKIDLGRAYFGEGITFIKDRLYQLTYKTKKGFVYDARTFKKLREFGYKGEGWGLTNDGTNLIMSTGTSNLYYLSPDSLNFLKMLAVQDDTGYMDGLNELEYINGYIYANKWLTSYILKIDPATGFVVAKMDLSKQISEIKSTYRGSEEMNGIAYDSVTRKTYITGKKWPVIYEIKW